LIFGSKWLVALPIFYCFAAGNLVSPSSTPMLGVLNAVGKSHLTLGMSFIWMLVTWIFGVLLMIRFGLIGFGIALLVLHLTNLALYWLVWRELRVKIWQAYWPSWPLAVVFGLILVLLQRFFPIVSVTALISSGVAFLIAYGVVLWLGFPTQARAWMRVLRQAA
jgi:O-antigen/teichoic acid export membrane protein